MGGLTISPPAVTPYRPEPLDMTGGLKLSSLLGAQQAQVQGQQLENTQRKMQITAAQQQAQSAQAFRDTFSKVAQKMPNATQSDLIDATTKELSRNPVVSPDTLQNLQLHSQDLRAKTASADDATLKLHSTQLDNLRGAFKPIYDLPADTPPDKLEAAYQQQRARVLQNPQAYGVVDQNTIPAQFPGKDMGELLMRSMIGQSKQIQEEKDLREGASSAAALPGIQAESQQKQRTLAGTGPTGITAEQQAQLASSRRGQDITIRGQNLTNARKTGDEQSIEAAAQALTDPKNLTALKDIASLRGDQRLMIFKRAREIDPNFDPGITNERVKFLQSYEDPKGRAATNRQAINNVLQHAGDLSDLNEEYRRSSVRVINTPLNAIARQFGNDAYTKFSTTNSVLKDELSLYFAGGFAPSTDQQKTWDRIQSDTATPAQTEAFAKEVVHLGLRRATTFNSQFKHVMGYDDPNMIIPEAKNAAENLGLGAEVSRFGSGGQMGGRQQQQQAGAPPVTAVGPNGHRITVKNGRWVDARTGAPIQ